MKRHCKATDFAFIVYNLAFFVLFTNVLDYYLFNNVIVEMMDHRRNIKDIISFWLKVRPDYNGTNYRVKFTSDRSVEAPCQTCYRVHYYFMRYNKQFSYLHSERLYPVPIGQNKPILLPYISDNTLGPLMLPRKVQ